MWVFYNYRQQSNRFELDVLLDSCPDFLTFYQTHHMQRVKLRLGYDFSYLILSSNIFYSTHARMLSGILSWSHTTQERLPN